LFLQGDGNHDDLIVWIRFVSWHGSLHLGGQGTYSTVSTVCVTCAGAGTAKPSSQPVLGVRPRVRQFAPRSAAETGCISSQHYRDALLALR
jgi:hypothetical protein